MSTILIWGLIEPFQASIKGAPHPVVNFINILCVHFLYESELSSFILIIDEIDTWRDHLTVSLRSFFKNILAVSILYLTRAFIDNLRLHLIQINMLDPKLT